MSSDNGEPKSPQQFLCEFMEEAFPQIEWSPRYMNPAAGGKVQELDKQVQLRCTKQQQFLLNVICQVSGLNAQNFIRCSLALWIFVLCKGKFPPLKFVHWIFNATMWQREPDAFLGTEKYQGLHLRVLERMDAAAVDLKLEQDDA